MACDRERFWTEQNYYIAEGKTATTIEKLCEEPLSSLGGRTIRWGYPARPSFVSDKNYSLGC
jgi:hypothetical protein